MPRSPVGQGAGGSQEGYYIRFLAKDPEGIPVADSLQLLRGTLDILILKTLAGSRLHGYAIASRIAARTRGALAIEDGALYQSLHRMAERGPPLFSLDAGALRHPSALTRLPGVLCLQRLPDGLLKRETQRLRR